MGMNRKHMNCFVSLCIIAYNEELFLPDLLKNVADQTYPHEDIEVVLVDGASTDSTRSILDKFAQRNEAGFRSVKVFDNPKRLQSAGWNVAIDGSSGEIMIRVDAHAWIPSDFIEKNVQVLEEGEYVCGGPRPTIVKDPTHWREVLHSAEESAFGSNVASYRGGSKAHYVASVFHGAYRREVLDTVGHFDERLYRTEDNEFHYRIRQKGFKIRFDPAIHSAQYVRSSLGAMLKQKYGNGYWIGRTLYIQPRCFQVYHFAPLVFVIALFALLAIGIISDWMPLAIAATIYTLICVALTLKVVWESEKKYASMALLPFLFFGIHFVYGFGTFAGILSGLRRFVQDRLIRTRC